MASTSGTNWPSGQFSADLLALRCFMYSIFLSPFPFKILAVFLNYYRSYFLIFLFGFFNMWDPAGFSGYRGIGMHFHEISRFPARSHIDRLCRGKALDWKTLSRAGAGCHGIKNRSRFRALFETHFLYDIFFYTASYIIAIIIHALCRKLNPRSPSIWKK